MHPRTSAHKYAKPVHTHTLTKIKENTYISKNKLDLLLETNRKPVSESRSPRPTLATGGRVVGERGLLNRQHSEARPHSAREEASSHQDARLPFAHRSVPSPHLSRHHALSIFDIIHGGFVGPEKTTSWHMRTWLVLWGWNCLWDDVSTDHQQTKANME